MSPLTDRMEEMIDLAIERGDEGVALGGPNWVTAYGLVNRGLGRIDVTEVEAGAVTRFVADDRAAQMLADARAVDLPPIAHDPLYPQRAIIVAAKIAGANVDQLLSRWKAPKILVRGRWAVMMGMRRRGVPITQIARRLRRDHSSVCYGLRKGKSLFAENEEFAAIVEQVDAA